MKNKLSRFAVPYEVWMAIFVVAPILIMVIYAFSSSEGGFTLDNFVQMGGYTQVFLRSFKLAIIATLICLVIGYPVSYLMSREGPAFQRTAMVLMNDLPMADIDSLRADTQELESLKARKNMLDILLSALLERERFVIMAHLVSGLRWRETVKRYSDEYGDWMTEGALKYVMCQGLERMVEVSQQMNEA